MIIFCESCMWYLTHTPLTYVITICPSQILLASLNVATVSKYLSLPYYIDYSLILHMFYIWKYIMHRTSTIETQVHVDVQLFTNLHSLSSGIKMTLCCHINKRNKIQYKHYFMFQWVCILCFNYACADRTSNLMGYIGFIEVMNTWLNYPVCKGCFG